MFRAVGVMELRQFLGELKSRNVYRTAAVYCAGAWVLLQVADVIFPIIGMPDWSVTGVLVLAAIGFPIALVLSWLFEITPEKDIAPEHRAIAEGNFPLPRVIELTLILLLCGLVGYLYVGRLTPELQVAADPEITETSIAVLPFVNLSEQSDLEYLGDGLAEEILNLLARLNELNVAARTSSFYFKNKDVDIQTIGRQLGVAHVLEGSMRVAGDRVRVTAQLIKTEDGFHLWSETYDRPVEDLLAFQDEIAMEVVEQLQLLISSESRNVLAPGPDIDPRAYDFYLRGRSYLRGSGTAEEIRYAIALFEKAAEVNEDFADAHAGLCDANLQLYGETRDTAEFNRAEDACQRALTLDRRAPSVYVALGQLYLASGQVEQAINEFDTAIALKPKFAEAYLGLGDAYLEQGKLALAEETYRKALNSQSDNWLVQTKLGNFYFLTGQPKKAIPFYRRIAELMPDNTRALDNLGAAFFVDGQFQLAVDAWERGLEANPSGLTYANVATGLYYMKRYDEALPLYHKAVEQAPEDYQLWGNLGDVYRHLPEVREMSGPMYRNAIKLAEKKLSVNANDAFTHGLVGHYRAALGERDESLASIARALEIAPDDLYVNYSAATAYASLGEMDLAMSALESALDQGLPMHMALADANLEELKELPRFEATMARRE